MPPPRFILPLLALVLAALTAPIQAQSFSLGTSALIEAPTAGKDSILLKAPAKTAAWKATSDAPWLHLVPATARGKGDARVDFAFDANPGPARSGTLTIGEQALTVTQAAAGSVPAQSVPLLSDPLGLAFGVAVDGAGNIYFTEEYGGFLKEYVAATGKIVTLVTSTSIVGVAVDADGNVYFSDQTAGAIRKYVAASQSVVTLYTDAGLNIYGLALDADGNVFFITDSDVREFLAATGTVSVLAGSAASGIARGLAVDGAGNVYFPAPGPDAVDGVNRFGVPLIQEYTPATGAVSTLLSGRDDVTGLAVDSSGNVFFADAIAGVVGEFVAATHAVTTIGQFQLPSGLALDPAGNLYIGGAGFIREYAPATGSTTPVISDPVDGATRAAVDSAGHLYFASYFDAALKVYAPETQTLSTLAATGLVMPGDVALDRAGDVYIADAGDRTIKKYSHRSGQLETLVSSGLVGPVGLALDQAGNIYIADQYANALLEYVAATGKLKTLFGLLMPTSVAVDRLGNVYVACTGEDVVGKYVPETGKVSLLFAAPKQNDPTTYPPLDVAVDGSGNVYLSGEFRPLTMYCAATKKLEPLGVYPYAVASDASGNLWFADYSTAEAMPRAFLDARTQLAPVAAGTGSIALTGPPGLALTGDFAPGVDQDWLSITSVEASSVSFALTATDLASRLGHIELLGRSIPVLQGADPAPVIYDVTAYVGKIAPVSIALPASNSSPAGFDLTLSAVGPPAEGRAAVGAGNVIVYTPPSFFGMGETDSFTYTMSDGHGGTATAMVQIQSLAPLAGTHDAALLDTGLSKSGAVLGHLTLTVNSVGGFTGVIRIRDKTFPFHGTFGADGLGYAQLRHGLETVTVYLQFDAATESMLTANAYFENLPGPPGADNFLSTTAHLNASEPFIWGQSAGAYLVRLDPPPAPPGTAATATALVSDGQVLFVEVKDGGSGYLTSPRVTLAGGGRGAVATATLEGGQVVGITVFNGGVHYPEFATTVLIDPPSAGLPAGTGWARMTIGTRGAVALAGKLGDGTVFSAGALLHEGASVSFDLYAALYAGASHPDAPGVIAGPVTFLPQNPGNCTGELAWTKPEQRAGRYSSGFDTSVTFAGQYFSGSLDQPALRFTQPDPNIADLTLAGGGLPGILTNELSLSDRNKVTPLPPNADKLTLQINPTRGTFTGTSAAGPISGIIDQDNNIGIGLFIGKYQAGTVLLSPR